MFQTAQDNIDLQTTILSRFDLIFIVKDVRMYTQDKVTYPQCSYSFSNSTGSAKLEERCNFEVFSATCIVTFCST